MILPDVNVYVCAHRPEDAHHVRGREWLEALLRGPAAFAFSDVILSGFVRIVTNPRIFKTPTPLDTALAFADAVRSPRHAIRVIPGPHLWSIFSEQCRRANAKGNLITDAYFAALAIESGSELVSFDHDFARFPDLRWRPPF
jgi:uncharacterized protein